MAKIQNKTFIGVMPYNEMVEQYVIPPKERNTLDWSKVDEDSRWWIGGQFDGDGSVGVYSGFGLKISVGKAENGWATIDILQSLLGGNVQIMSDETDVNQACKMWTIQNRTALEFCRVMKDYCFLKRPQIIEALRYPVDEMKLKMMQPVCALNVKTGEPERRFVSSLHAAKTVKTQTGHISEVIQGKKPTCAKYKWAYLENPIKKDEVLDKFKKLSDKLKEMKHVIHENLLQDMPLPYAAGFIDADGSINHYSRLRLNVVQKYQAICDAFAKQFGGHVRNNSGYHEEKFKSIFLWELYGSQARSALHLIAPYLIEKKSQALIVTSSKLIPADICQELQKLQGRQKGKLVRLRSPVDQIEDKNEKILRDKRNEDRRQQVIRQRTEQRLQKSVLINDLQSEIKAHRNEHLSSPVI